MLASVWWPEWWHTGQARVTPGRTAASHRQVTEPSQNFQPQQIWILNLLKTIVLAENTAGDIMNNYIYTNIDTQGYNFHLAEKLKAQERWFIIYMF